MNGAELIVRPQGVSGHLMGDTCNPFFSSVKLTA